MEESEYYTLEDHLESFKHVHSEYASLHNNWCLDKKEIAKALSAIPHFFPHYSDHDESHSLKIIRNIEMLLGSKRIKSLSPTTTWLILMSVYLHDTGMILVDNILKDKWTKDDFQKFIYSKKTANYSKYDEDYIIAADYITSIENHLEEKDWPLKVRQSVILLASEYFRSKHPQYSRGALEKLEEYGLSISGFRTVPQRLKHLIGTISFLHGQPFEEVMQLDYESNGVGTDKVFPRFIAELVRIGDLLDLDDGRFTKVYQKMLTNIPKLSETHEKKHASIRHFLISPQVIEITADCENAEVYRVTQGWIDWLKEEMKNLAVHWSEIVPTDFIGGPPRIGKCKLYLQGKDDSSEQANLRFEIQQEDAFEILEGSGIYNSKLVFLRELIQNAIDASKFQMWSDIHSGIFDSFLRNEGINSVQDIKFVNDIPHCIWDSYDIEVHLQTKEIKGITFIEINISDRGCGISKDELVGLSSVGDGWRKNERKMSELIQMPVWLRPTGNFGIGLQSVFLVSDFATITTKVDGEVAKKLSISSRKKNGYVTIEDVEQKKRGTNISLLLREDICKQIVREEVEYDYFLFDDQYTSLFYDKVLKYIKNSVKETFFNIRINIDDMPTYTINNMKYEKDDFENIDEHSRAKFVFDPETGSFTIMFLENNIGSSLQLYFRESDSLNYAEHIISIYFKGIQLSDSSNNPRLYFIRANYDLLGIETKRFINIARTSLRRENLEFLNDYFLLCVQKALKFTFDHLHEEKDRYLKYANEVEKQNKRRKGKKLSLAPIAKLLLACEYYLPDIKCDASLAKEFVGKTIEFNLFDTNLNKIDNREIIDANVVMMISPHRFDAEINFDLYTIKQVFPLYSHLITDEIKLLMFNNNWETMQYFYQHFYVSNFSSQSIEWTDIDLSHLIEDDKEELLYTDKLDFILLRRFDNHMIKLETSTEDRSSEIKNLIKKFKERAVIYPIPQYEKLVVKKIPKFYEHSIFDIGENSLSYENLFIISPFVSSKMRNQKFSTKNELFDYAINSMGLNKLIDWVVKNSINPSTKKEIHETYKKLIFEFWDLLKQED
ncbi:HD domain-containing protein [Cohnella candidum]|uniref:HD-CE domain-containing protein n=1 Tax=Cohnella candidum TaxID=2674991 RepID=A0A3G3JYR9_9BACL|nr:ATP-binding protein [Cohnella candidum]AYQ73302.1 hypothetical protein EAV92_12425 [Cohnella candidum]